MRTFKDSKDRTWQLDLTVGAMRRLKANIGVDLTRPEDPVDEEGKFQPESKGTLAQMLAASLMLFVDVLFQLVASQAKQASVDVDEFCDSIPPAIAKTAREQFREEWSDFFRQLGRIDQLRIVQGAFDLQQQLETQGAESVAKLSGKLSEKLADIMQNETDKALAELDRTGEQTSGNSSTSVPESLGDSLANSTT